MKPAQTGLTMIELLMTIAIIGILASVAVPSFSSTSAAQQVTGAAEKIRLDMLFARSEAMKQNKNIYLSFSTGSNWCYGFTDTGAACTCSTANSCKINNADKAVKSAQFKNISLTTAGSLTLNGANFDPARGGVKKSGTAINNGSITITQDGASATIMLNVLGRASICSSTLAQFSACL